MFFYLVVDQTETSIHVSGYCNIFFCMFTLKKYFMLKIIFVYNFNPSVRIIDLVFKVLHVLKTHCDCFNSQYK